MSCAPRPVYLSLLALLLLVRPAAAPATAEVARPTAGGTTAASERIVCGRPVANIDPGASSAPVLEIAREPLPARPFAEIIHHASMRHGVDPALISALIEVESSYRPDAVSPAGAMGLMQLMPATARQYEVTDPYDPTANIEAGTKHLRSLLDRYDDLDLALAAYQAGDAPVRKFGGVPPYATTRQYVTRILDMVGVRHE